MAKTAVFTPEQFTNSEHYDAKRKADWSNRLIHFFKNGFKPGLFTQSVYDLLHLHFGHIAHGNIQGFYETWFSNPHRQVAFIKHMLDHQPRSPSFADVEQAIQRWLTENNILDKVQDEASHEQKYESVEGVARLILKVAKKPITPERVNHTVAIAKEQIEAVSGTTLGTRVDGIAAVLQREFCQSQETFVLASISKNTNSFGLNGYIFVAKSGETWECAGARNHLKYEMLDKVVVPLKNGVPNWSSLGFEIPTRRPQDAQPDVIEALWGK